MAGAVVAALLAFTAVPVVLFVVVGNPLSGGLGHTWHAGSRDALFVVALAAWVAWAASCAQLVRGVAVHVRSGDVRGHGVSILDHVAARIAVGVLALSSVGGPIFASASAGATVPPVLSSTFSGQHSPAEPAPVRVDGAQKRETDSSYQVDVGDTLWSIADDQLDDGADWTTLAGLNLGRDMGGAECFIDPDHIREGWRLRLPEGTRRPGHRATESNTHAEPDHLPELLALGMGSLACAALARRTRRRRSPEPFRGDLDLGDAGLGDPESEGAVDAAALLGRFDGIPALEAFESANGMLGRAVAAGESMPIVRAVNVGPRGVTFWLNGRCHDAPAGFDAVDGGTGWQRVP